MRLVTLLLPFLLFAGMCMAFEPSSPCSSSVNSLFGKPKKPRLKLNKVRHEIYDGELMITLEVRSNSNLNSYPRAIAYLNDNALNDKTELEFYAHLEGDTLEYVIVLPSEYEDKVNQMQFSILQSTDEEIPLKRKRNNK